MALFQAPLDQNLGLPQISKKVTIDWLGCPITRSNCDPSGTVVDYLEQSEPSQTIWKEQKYLSPPGGPSETVSNHLKTCQTSWKTISEHLGPTPTNSDYLEGIPFQFSPQCTAIGLHQGLCSCNHSDLFVSYIHNSCKNSSSSKFNFTQENLIFSMQSQAWLSAISRSFDKSRSIWVLYHFHIGCKNCFHSCSCSCSFHFYSFPQ